MSKDQKFKEKQKKVEKEQKKEKTCEEKLEGMTNLLRSVQADFINYKTRTEKEKIESAYYFKKEIITQFLPVLDMFSLALKHTKNHEDFVKGMEMIYAQLINTLENEGLEFIKEEKFNPEYHEAIITEESDEPEGTILEELQKGYMLNKKVIRCSRVKVAKNKNANSKIN